MNYKPKQLKQLFEVTSQRPVFHQGWVIWIPSREIIQTTLPINFTELLALCLRLSKRPLTSDNTDRRHLPTHLMSLSTTALASGWPDKPSSVDRGGAGQVDARCGQEGQEEGTHRCNSPLGVANSSPCLLAHPAGYLMDNCVYTVGDSHLTFSELSTMFRCHLLRKCYKLTTDSRNDSRWI